MELMKVVKWVDEMGGMKAVELVVLMEYWMVVNLVVYLDSSLV